LLASNRRSWRASIIWSRRRGHQRLRRASPAPGDHFLSLHPTRSPMGCLDMLTGQRGAAYERNRLARRRFDRTICALACRTRLLRGEWEVGHLPAGWACWEQPVQGCAGHNLRHVYGTEDRHASLFACYCLLWLHVWLLRGVPQKPADRSCLPTRPCLHGCPPPQLSPLPQVRYILGPFV
jgi:hypothetical protein